MKSKKILTPFSFLVVAWSLSVQIVPAQSITYIAVRTNLPDAILFADSLRIGPASQGIWAVPATTKRIRLLAPQHEAWSIAPIASEINENPEDTTFITLDFPYYHKIESIPFGAFVRLETPEGWQTLGNTPLIYTSMTLLDGVFVVRMDGYALQRIEPGTKVWNRYDVTLSQSSVDDRRVSEVRWLPPRKPRKWIDYAAVGTAITAGVLAIHYKFEADRLYDQYEETTDSSLRPKINRYDTRSTIALGVMEASLGIFAIRLILR